VIRKIARGVMTVLALFVGLYPIALLQASNGLGVQSRRLVVISILG
jgi:hypothetical protein